MGELLREGKRDRVRLSTDSISMWQIQSSLSCEPIVWHSDGSSFCVTKDDEERAYRKLISVCGRESMFLLRAKATRYNVG